MKTDYENRQGCEVISNICSAADQCMEIKQIVQFLTYWSSKVRSIEEN